MSFVSTVNCHISFNVSENWQSRECLAAARVARHILFIALDNLRTRWTSARLSGKLETTDVLQCSTGRLHESGSVDVFAAIWVVLRSRSRSKPSTLYAVIFRSLWMVMNFACFSLRSRHCCNRCRTSSRLCRTRSSEGISLTKTCPENSVWLTCATNNFPCDSKK